MCLTSGQLARQHIADLKIDASNSAADAAKVREERDAETRRAGAAERRCREANQILVQAVGADGPDTVGDAARRAARRIAELEKEIESLESTLESTGCIFCFPPEES